jgi:dolichol-phosphate mannosyltransferase
MVRVSIVIPIKNEEESIASLVKEIRETMEGRFTFEIICINDGSTDATLSVLGKLQSDCPHLKVWSHQTSSGQSRAVYHGVHLARHPIIATLDADGQNVPADIPAMVEKLLLLDTPAPMILPAYRLPPTIFDTPGKTALIAGYRKYRNDTWVKRVSSKIANKFRGWALRDRTPDTGCGLKVFYREVFLRLPYFDHMHRFLPALVRRIGYGIAVHEVKHRPRRAGNSKYGLHDRLWAGIIDTLGVIWLQRRCKPVEIVEESKNE